MLDLTHTTVGVKTSIGMIPTLLSAIRIEALELTTLPFTANSLVRAQRLERLRRAIAEHDFQTLLQLAREKDGFVQDSYRRMIWPILLRTHQGSYVDEKGTVNGISDPIQISKDVQRSLYYYPQDITPSYKAFKQQELHDMIIEILWRNPRLRYYQQIGLP
ncbi:hypothetical protein BC940DRAFT_336980 [Gongronella butleri]|nr:hypothetical protein BC940DRAFT_336980 [Gongronella butleri]